MPYMTNGKRDYKKELAQEKKAHPERVKERAERNHARATLGLKVGDPREADHQTPLSKGGSGNKSNLRAVSAHLNDSYPRNSDSSMKHQNSKLGKHPSHIRKGR